MGIGEFFFHLTVVVVLVSVLLLFVPHKMNKYFFILAGFFTLTTGAFLIGPSALLGLPNELKLMKAGMCVAGVGMSPMMSFGMSYAL